MGKKRKEITTCVARGVEVTNYFFFFVAFFAAFFFAAMVVSHPS
jgi:hypothetical protein